jgi:uncharacterized protein YkwD
MNGIIISLIFLIVVSMVLPASAIMYASGQSTDNSGSSTTGGSPTTDNSGSSTTGGGSNTTTTDNSGSSSTGGSTTTADNSATLPTTSTASNNTGNIADLANTILAVHNSEHGAVGVPPLVWNDTLAADARTYAQYLADTGKSEHPTAEWVAAHPMSPEGENLAGL